MQIKGILLSALAAILSVSLFAGCGTDPNVKPQDSATDSYAVDMNATKDEALSPGNGFQAYPSGKTDPVTVDGVEVSPNDFALRSFELGYMLGCSFQDPGELSVDAAVQYGMTHIFEKNFYQLDNYAVAYRTVEPKLVEEELIRQFGKSDYDMTKSVFYNPTTKKLEMWLPEYGTDLYYHIDAADVSGSQLKVSTTFYNEKEKSTLFGKTAITVEVADGKPLIRSVSTQTE